MIAIILIYGFRSLILFTLWVILSDKRDSVHLVTGAVCAVILALAATPRIQKGTPFRPFQGFQLCWYGIRYAGWLLIQIIMAAIHVSKIILSPKISIAPRFIRHKTILRHAWQRVVFANSITLTPGTITADIEGDILTIHQIDDASAEGILSREMEKEIQKIQPEGSAT